MTSVRKKYLLLALYVFLCYLALCITVRILPERWLRKYVLILPYSNEALFLYDAGDFRYRYKNKELVSFTFYYPQGTEDTFPPFFSKEFTKELLSSYGTYSSTEGRIVTYPPHSDWTDADLEAFASENTSGDISVFFVNQYRPDLNVISKVIDHRSIAIFTNVTSHITLNVPDEIQLKLLLSLHQFGHLLGMKSINNDSCIMSNRYDKIGDAQYLEIPLTSPYHFCDQDRDEFKRAML